MIEVYHFGDYIHWLDIPFLNFTAHHMNKACINLTYFIMALLMAVRLPGQNTVESSAGKILTIKDFKGIPDESADYFAQTNPVVSIKYFAPSDCPEPGKIKLKVETSIYISEKSWMKISRIKSQEFLNALLSHEQGHYDLGIVFATDLKKTLSSTCFDKLRYKAQIDSAFKSMFARYDTLQRKYDAETDHMRHTELQAKWKQKIALMLKNIQQ